MSLHSRPIYSGGGYDPGMTLRDYFAIDAVLSARAITAAS